MNKYKKGGLMCLLSCFIVINTIKAQETFVTNKDPNSDKYGEISSPVIEDSILLKLYSKELSFPDWASFFSIKTNNSSKSTLGNYRIEESRIVFKPRFLPDPNVIYSISFDYRVFWESLEIQNKLDTSISESVTFQPLNAQATKVLGVYPPINTFPENLLKIYVYFSAPMGFSNPYDHIALVDQKGNNVENAFVELPNGLWNEDQNRLTLLFHPGRVKQGIGLNLKEGSPLKENELFKLVINEEWVDANGLPLSESFSKSFFVTSPSRKKLKSKSWKIDSQCKEECVLRLMTGDVIDVEMADRMIAILNEEKENVPYNLIAEPDGSYLIQSESIKKGKTYMMKVNSRLEDMCGNTFLNPFDYEEGTRMKEGKLISISFTVK